MGSVCIVVDSVVVVVVLVDASFAAAICTSLAGGRGGSCCGRGGGDCGGGAYLSLFRVDVSPPAYKGTGRKAASGSAEARRGGDEPHCPRSSEPEDDEVRNKNTRRRYSRRIDNSEGTLRPLAHPGYRKGACVRVDLRVRYSTATCTLVLLCSRPALPSYVSGGACTSFFFSLPLFLGGSK